MTYNFEVFNRHKFIYRETPVITTRMTELGRF